MIQFRTSRCPSGALLCLGGRLRTLGSPLFALLMQATTGAASEGSSTGILNLIARSTAISLAVLFGLGLMSIWSWGIFLYKWWTFRRAAKQSAQFLEVFRRSNKFSEVQAVWAHEIGGARMFNVVSIKQRYAGHARQAGHILNQCGVGAYMSRYSVVVDDDIDPSNLQEVMWAVATRTDPALDIDIIQRGMGSKNDPMYVAYPYAAPLSSKAIIDACRPWDHLDEFPAVAEASKELQDRIRQKWKGIL